MRRLPVVAFRLIALLAVIAAVAQAQVIRPGARPGVGSISGFIFDSIAGKPLAGAEVLVVDAANPAAPGRTATSDSLGRYRVMQVPAGRYLVGFMHPVLDSLGIEPRPRDVAVLGGPVRNDLGLPSPPQLRRMICGDSLADDDALILGFVRRAEGRTAVDSAVVRAQWVEVALQGTALARRTAVRSVTAGASGWYAMCGAPTGGTVLLRAARGADSTESLEMNVPKSGLLKRDLYFGRAQVVRGEASGVPGDSGALSLGVRRTGTGRLSGIVLGAATGEPIVNARIGVVNGSQTRSDAAGRFTLTALPTGTRMLEVRAVGRYPILMPVDILDSVPPLKVTMVTLESVLDTVRVTASRGNRVLAEFNERRKQAGSGRFIGADDVARRRPVFTTDMLRGLPGVSVQRDRNGEEFLEMRGGASGSCRAAVFLNGMELRGLSAGEINGFVQPRDLIGIEVHPAATSPPQYRDQNGCGSVLIWSR